MLSESSSQASGTDTDADGNTRVEYGATAVAPRPFLKQSMNIRPRRDTFAMVAT